MNGYIERNISQSIRKAYSEYSVITVTGPRQSGKTTLIKHLFPELPYFSLENYDIRSLAVSDPVGFLNSSSKGMILDEAQNAPLLFSYIQGMVDDNPRLRFILSGSSNFSMLKSVAQSLAGRTAIFELLPFSMSEIDISETSSDELMFKGLYPSVWRGGKTPEMMYRNYISTYLERDVRDLLAIKDLNNFQKFLQLCATRIGSVFNASELSNELGVSSNTVKSWLSVLMASYIIVMLQPFYTNTRKRLTKSPKIYFTDTGLACNILGIESARQLQRDKMRGHLFENLVITEALKHRLNNGKRNNLCFYRDSNGNEVDLVIKKDGLLNLFEIKSSETYHPEFEKGIKTFCAEFPDVISEKAIVYTGSLENTTRDIKLMNYKTFAGFM